MPNLKNLIPQNPSPEEQMLTLKREEVALIREELELYKQELEDTKLEAKHAARRSWIAIVISGVAIFIELFRGPVLSWLSSWLPL